MSDYHPPLRPTPPRAWEVIKPRTITPSDSPVIPASVSSELVFPLTPDELRTHVRVALDEDQATNDVSTLATVVSTRHVRSTLVARRDGVIAGIPLAAEAFRQMDASITVRVDAADGTNVAAGAPVLHLTGHARGMLSAERVALNLSLIHI